MSQQERLQQSEDSAHPRGYAENHAYRHELMADETKVTLISPPSRRISLQTRRLTLRCLQPDDFAASHLGIFQTGSVTSHEAGVRFAKQLPRLAERDFGGWTVLDRSTGGRIGLFIYAGTGSTLDTAIISYALEPTHRRRGLGTEAAACAVGHLFDAAGFRLVLADVELANTASLHLLARIGFHAATSGATPGVQVAPSRPAQRWLMSQSDWCERTRLPSRLSCNQPSL